MTVRIASVSVAHPTHRIPQMEAARRISDVSNERQVAALARATGIEQRALALSPDALACLGAAGSRNDAYRRLAPPLALSAARAAIADASAADIECLVTTSCTGYSAPSLAVGLARDCGLVPTVTRLPINEAGCAGGALALARGADYLAARGGGDGLVVATELCSLAFHAGGDIGNVTSKLLFGDGAGAALLRSGVASGVEVVDSISWLIPETERMLGFRLTDQGFYPELSQELPGVLPGPTKSAVEALLGRHGLEVGLVDAWLLHPGGPRILRTLEVSLSLAPSQTRWSWASLREFGNTSSAAVFDVLRRYMPDAASGEYAVLAAFGPGVSIELLLLRAC